MFDRLLNRANERGKVTSRPMASSQAPLSIGTNAFDRYIYNTRIIFVKPKPDTGDDGCGGIVQVKEQLTIFLRHQPRSKHPPILLRSAVVPDPRHQRFRAVPTKRPTVFARLRASALIVPFADIDICAFERFQLRVWR